jgi:hypothetical protein
MNHHPMRPVDPPVPLYKPLIGLLSAFIALAAGLATFAGFGAAALRLLEIHSIADHLLPGWPWWKLAALAASVSFIGSPVCGYAYKWANDKRNGDAE